MSEGSEAFRVRGCMLSIDPVTSSPGPVRPRRVRGTTN